MSIDIYEVMQALNLVDFRRIGSIFSEAHRQILSDLAGSGLKGKRA